MQLFPRRYLQLLIVPVLLLFSAAVALSSEKRPLSEAQAVRLAEHFIARNGYTDLPPDKSNLAHESIELDTIDEELELRRDTLERKAYGISHGRKNGAPGWTVVFRQRHSSYFQLHKTGRAVTMNLDGSGMQVEHVDFFLKRVQKKL